MHHFACVHCSKRERKKRERGGRGFVDPTPDITREIFSDKTNRGAVLPVCRWVRETASVKERERETETERDREIQRQRDRQTDRNKRDRE